MPLPRPDANLPSIRPDAGRPTRSQAQEPAEKGCLAGRPMSRCRSEPFARRTGHGSEADRDRHNTFADDTEEAADLGHTIFSHNTSRDPNPPPKLTFTALQYYIFSIVRLARGQPSPRNSRGNLMQNEPSFTGHRDLQGFFPAFSIPYDKCSQTPLPPHGLLQSGGTPMATHSKWLCFFDSHSAATRPALQAKWVRFFESPLRPHPQGSFGVFNNL